MDLLPEKFIGASLVAQVSSGHGRSLDCSRTSQDPVRHPRDPAWLGCGTLLAGDSDHLRFALRLCRAAACGMPAHREGTAQAPALQFVGGRLNRLQAGSYTSNHAAPHVYRATSSTVVSPESRAFTPASRSEVIPRVAAFCRNCITEEPATIISRSSSLIGRYSKMPSRPR